MCIKSRNESPRAQSTTAEPAPPPPPVKSLTKSTKSWKIRLFTLFALCFNDGTYTVLRRYSRGVLEEKYSFHEVLLAAEFLKLFFAVWMIKKSHVGEKDGNGKTLPSHLLWLFLRSQKMFLLAMIYGTMNIFSFVALRNIGAGTFVIIAQMKTLSTALFSSLLLRRQYSWAKWRALILLVAGIILFVMPTLEESKASDAARSASVAGIVMGCTFELAAVVMSGFASIYFEKAIKNDGDQLGIWERNFQLALHSIPVYVTMMVVNGGGTVGYGRGWTPLAVVLMLLGATGGLLVALSIKYGDSVLKTLAISGSIIYASVVDHAFLDGPLTRSMAVSALVVIIAVFNYTFDYAPATLPSKASVNGMESVKKDAEMKELKDVERQ